MKFSLHLVRIMLFAPMLARISPTVFDQQLEGSVHVGCACMAMAVWKEIALSLAYTCMGGNLLYGPVPCGVMMSSPCTDVPTWPPIINLFCIPGSA